MILNAKELKRNKRWAIVIGLGLALSPIHSLWLTELVTEDGVVGFFIPAFGMAIWFIGAGAFLVYNWESLGLGNKWVYIPLFVIAGSMAISGFVSQPTFGDKITPSIMDWVGIYSDKATPGLMGLVLVGIYVVSRTLGARLFRPLIPLVLIGVVLAVIGGIVNSDQSYAEQPITLITNYCALAGFLILGGIVNQGRYQWVLLTVVLVGLFFVGALEAVFIVGVLGITMLLRRDIDKRLIISMGVVACLVILWAVLGNLAPLYRGGSNNVETLFNVLVGTQPLTPQAMNMITSGRWVIIVREMQNISFWGHGYSLSTVGGGIVHNIPLIIVHQIGILPAIAWVFVTAYCLIKTKWKYAWMAILAMCVFDHYLWTQFTPYWWALVGVSTASGIENDYLCGGRHVRTDNTGGGI